MQYLGGHMMRKHPVFIVGNWKMYKTIVEARTFISSLVLATSHCSIQIGLAVPFTMISAAADAARGSLISIGAQNLFEAEEGGYTGEISASQIKDAGGSFVLIGHSERRQLFHEDSLWINRKVKKSLSEGLRVVLCVGETLEQHQAGQTQTVLRDQLTKSLQGITPEECENVVLAYEPVWAIGTNRTATPEIAEAAHQFCRLTIAELKGSLVAEQMIIQYGGSVNAENTAELLVQPDINGLLIGRASLTLESFTKIIQTCTAQ